MTSSGSETVAAVGAVATRASSLLTLGRHVSIQRGTVVGAPVQHGSISG